MNEQERQYQNIFLAGMGFEDVDRITEFTTTVDDDGRLDSITADYGHSKLVTLVFLEDDGDE